MASNAPIESRMARKPQLSFWQIWNMCFGFLGIQFGFALQNANVSRIFQTLGAEMDSLPGLWIAAPLTGLIVQPIIGYLSDRTWTGLGRRRPYFLVGAVLSSIALIFMPDSPTLWIAAGLLWVLDASINISMEPFRAFVGDQLPVSQRAKGYAMQSFFIGIGQEHVKLGRVVALVYHPPVFGPGMAGCGQQRGAQPSRGTAGNLAIYVHVTFLVGKCFPADRG